MVDVFDALIETRPYRPALSGSQALGLMVRERGKQFDPAILDCFVELVDQRTWGESTPGLRDLESPWSTVFAPSPGEKGLGTGRLELEEMPESSGLFPFVGADAAGEWPAGSFSVC